MKKRIKLFFIICLLFFITLNSCVSGFYFNHDVNYSKNTISSDILDKGYIEESNGVTVLHIEGTYYEMGYQHGSLLSEECEQNVRAFLSYAEEIGYPKHELIKIWNKMKKHVPENYIEEILGLSDGSGVLFEDIVSANIVIDCLDVMGCFGLSFWGTATKDDAHVHARSCDLPFIFKDPISGKFAHENSILIVRQPIGGHASLIPSVAFKMNLGGGINEKGIGLSVQVSPSKDYQLSGMPIGIKNQLILDKSSSIYDAIDYINTNKTIGLNYIISDAEGSLGKVVEVASNMLYVGSWNDQVENTPPFYSIENVVRRTNFFIEPKIAKTQRNYYDIGGFDGFFRFFIKSIESAIFNNDEVFSTDYMYPLFRSYTVVSKNIEKNFGELDLVNTLEILNKIYNDKCDILIKSMIYIGKVLGKDYHVFESWNQWSADLKTGDMLLSFAEKNSYASENNAHIFNLYNLIN